MSSTHYVSRTKTKSYSFDRPIIESLSAIWSVYVKSQSWTKPNRDLWLNISSSRDEAIKKSLPNYKPLLAVSLSPTRLSRDGSESSKMAISHVTSILHKFLERYPFSSARAIWRHFRSSPPTVKEILGRELGLKKFSRRWVPHVLSEDQKR
jgi:hypothetical protein